MTTQTPQSGARVLTGTMIGVVVSDHRDKTRAVEVTYQARHAKYGKYLTRTTRYHVHDAENKSRNGDHVEIANCRPISKTKSWRLVKVVSQSQGVEEHKTEA